MHCKLNKFAQEVEYEVRTTVIQVVETAPGKVALRLTPDVLVDNVLYKDQENNNTGKENRAQTCEKYTTLKNTKQ